MVELEKNTPPAVGRQPADDSGIEVLAVLAHELRNPLAPIRNGAELLRTLCTDPRQLQIVETISRQVTHLTRLLDDVLDGARLRRGLLTLQKQMVDVDVIVETALEAIRPAINARRQNLLVSLPATPVRMHCDATRLVQVLQNLLDNANRYTPEGGTLWVKADVTEDRLLLEVSDNGEGLDPDLLPRLFNVFAQGEQPLHRPNGGLGLGLAIVRNIVEMHGGSISADSAGRGRGTRIRVQLPIEQVPDPSGSIASVPSARKQARVIVIDDSYLVAVSLIECLKDRGYDAAMATSGEAGLVLAEEFLPQAAVLDIGLPGVDGFEIARRLRQRFPGIVLIAVSGYSWTMLKNADVTLFARYLTKPADPDRIVAAIEEHVPASPASAEGNR
jgi:CheY-like chemotaxis protein/two-component sensor histidine kinase